MGNRWQIKNDDETGPTQAAVQFIREDGAGKREVWAWMMFNREQLLELSAAALRIADHIKGREEIGR